MDNVWVSHENCNRRQHNGFTMHELVHCVTYIKNYVETNEYSSQVKYQDIKEWTFNYYQLIQPNDQFGESRSRRVGLYTFILQVITAFVKFGRSFSLISSSQNQNLTFCWICQRNNRTISSTTNLSESVKQQVNLNILYYSFIYL